jgi:hypothetical protein
MQIIQHLLGHVESVHLSDAEMKAIETQWFV